MQIILDLIALVINKAIPVVRMPKENEKMEKYQCLKEGKNVK